MRNYIIHCVTGLRVLTNILIYIIYDVTVKLQSSYLNILHFNPANIIFVELNRDFMQNTGLL